MHDSCLALFGPLALTLGDAYVLQICREFPFLVLITKLLAL
jgi:hypothetical protein